MSWSSQHWGKGRRREREYQEPCLGLSSAVSPLALPESWNGVGRGRRRLSQTVARRQCRVSRSSSCLRRASRAVAASGCVHGSHLPYRDAPASTPLPLPVVPFNLRRHNFSSHTRTSPALYHSAGVTFFEACVSSCRGRLRSCSNATQRHSCLAVLLSAPLRLLPNSLRRACTFLSRRPHLHASPPRSPLTTHTHTHTQTGDLTLVLAQYFNVVRAHRPARTRWRAMRGCSPRCRAAPPP